MLNIKKVKLVKNMELVHLEDYRLIVLDYLLFGMITLILKIYLLKVGYYLLKEEFRKNGETLINWNLKLNKIEMLDQLIDSENRNMIVEIPFDIVNDKLIIELLYEILSKTKEIIL